MSQSISIKPRIATSAATDDEIAPDLTTLMERMERARKFLQIEREYIKLVLMGMFFILCGAVVSNFLPWHLYMIIGFVASPWLFGWYRLPLVRLANAFRNETLPFLLRDYGRWNYAVSGSHFDRAGFMKCGLIAETDRAMVGNLITGERYGVPLQIVTIAAWKKPLMGFHRKNDLRFTGWLANVRLADIPNFHRLILPIGQKPAPVFARDWVQTELTPSHALWLPAAELAAAPHIPPALLARILTLMIENPTSRFAIYQGALWVFVPLPSHIKFEYFNQVDVMDVNLSEHEPYQEARTQLASVFAQIDKVVWPKSVS